MEDAIGDWLGGGYNTNAAGFQYFYNRSPEELEKFVKYKKDDYFKTHMQDINMSVSELNDNWDMCNSKTKTHEFIKQMETRIKERKNGESEHENS